MLHAVSPMLGAVVRLSPFSALYANVGSAFETPTTTELGNQPNGNAGLNYDLKPQFSTTYETGLKGLLADRVQYDLALFDTEVRDELIPFQVPNGNGRTYYRNAGRTRRNGVEVSGGTDVGPIALSAAYTYSHFRFRDFLSAGTQIAGTSFQAFPSSNCEGSATWRYSLRVRDGRRARQERGLRRRREQRSRRRLCRLQPPLRRGRCWAAWRGYHADAERAESLRQEVRRLGGDQRGRYARDGKVLRAGRRPNVAHRPNDRRGTLGAWLTRPLLRQLARTASRSRLPSRDAARVARRSRSARAETRCTSSSASDGPITRGAETQDVHRVVLDALMGRERVVTERRTNADELVRGYRGADAAAADQYTAIGLAIANRAPRRARRSPDSRRRESLRSAPQSMTWCPLRANGLDHPLFEREAGVIGTDSDLHRPAPAPTPCTARRVLVDQAAKCRR